MFLSLSCRGQCFTTSGISCAFQEEITVDEIIGKSIVLLLSIVAKSIVCYCLILKCLYYSNKPFPLMFKNILCCLPFHKYNIVVVTYNPSHIKRNVVRFFLQPLGQNHLTHERAQNQWGAFGCLKSGYRRKKKSLQKSENCFQMMSHVLSHRFLLLVLPHLPRYLSFPSCSLM